MLIINVLTNKKYFHIMVANSEIKQVTVYKDRAIIMRTLNCKLQKGENLVTVKGLPNGINSNSLQVNGSNNLILQDIKLQSQNLAKSSNDRTKKLMTKIEIAASAIAEIEDKINNLNEEKSILISLVSSASKKSKTTLSNLLLNDELIESLKSYDQLLNTIDKNIRNNKKELKKLNKSLKILEQELNIVGNNKIYKEKQLDLKIFSNSDTDTDISFSYMVYQASWKPIYDLRLNSEQKKLDINYNALVTQNTGEKWENVQLKLSTAQAQLSGKEPKLNRWDIFDTLLSGSANSISTKHAFIRKAIAADNDSRTVDDYDELLETASVEIETAATSVVFALNGTHTVDSNKEEHKVGITSMQLDAQLSYFSIPKVNPFSYLKAKSVNTSDFPLLKGETNVFLDNSFVAHSNIKLIAPGEEFKTSLGVDEGIHIDYKFKNRFKKDEGLFSKKTKIVFEYQIKIKNNKPLDSNITIQDQIPISQDDDIKVELLEPKLKEKDETIKILEDGILEWTLTVKSGETINLDLKFMIEHPKEAIIIGLDD